MQIIVLGMHRSGTSALAGLLNMMGAYFAPEGVGIDTNQENPKGFWERKDIRSLNDFVLHAQACDWNRIANFSTDKISEEVLAEFGARATKILLDLDAHRPWMIKEPRFCLLFSLWRRFFEMPICIHIHRNPLEVAMSLQKRNDIPVFAGIALWEKYNVDALNASTGLPRILLSHQSVINEPEQVVSSLYGSLTSLGVQGLRLPSDNEIKTFIDPGLYREKTQLDDMGQCLNMHQQKLLKRLDAGNPDTSNIPLTVSAGAISSLQAYESKQASDAALKHDLRVAGSSLASTEQALKKIKSVALQADKDLEICEGELAESRHLNKNLNATINELIAPVEALIDSTSWRLGSLLISLKYRVLMRRVPPLASTRISNLIAHHKQSNSLQTPGGEKLDYSTELESNYPLISVAREGDKATGFDSDRFTSSFLPLHKKRVRVSADRQLAALQGKKTTIIVAVYGAFCETKRCIDSVLAYTEIDFDLLIIDDCSADARIPVLLAGYESIEFVTTMRNSKNLGYVHTINKGIQQCSGDVVLLNSDTVVTSKWLQKMLVAAYSSVKVATVTPFSNAAGAFSVPEIGKNKELPASLSVSDMGRLVARVSERSLPCVPTGNGFCMFIRRDAIEELGLFDADKFSRGYGEENDFCMRAGNSGWLNLIDDSTFIYHKRSASFGDAKQDLIKSNRKILDKLHPDYSSRVKEFVHSKPINAIRKRIGRAVEYASAQNRALPKRILYVLHEGAGGTPQTNADLANALTSEYEAFILTSTLKKLILRRKKGHAFQVFDTYDLEEPLKGDTYSRPDVEQLYFDILLDLDIDVIHIRHLFKHSFDLPKLGYSLGIPVLLSFHDFYFVCPSVHLLDENFTYCGGVCTPGSGYCQVPAEQHKHLPRLKDYLPEWRQQVCSRVVPFCDGFITTSETSAEVYRKAFPELNSRRFRVIEHGRDFPSGPHKYYAKPGAGNPVKILIAGNIDPHKGQQFILDLKKHDRRGIIEYHFLGVLADELKGVGHYHGKYTRDDFHHHVERIKPSFIGIFPIWPETYCHTLTEGIACGIPVLATKIGTIEERIGKLGAGWLLDLDKPAAAVDKIYHIVDTPQEYDRVLKKVSAARFKSTIEMADEYEYEYKMAIANKRKDAVNVKNIVLFTPLRASGMAGSSYVRTVLPLGHPSVAESIYSRYVNYISYSDREIIRRLKKSKIDGIVVQRTGLPLPLTDSLLELCKSKNIPIVYEVDDNLLAIDAHHPEFTIYQNDVANIKKIIDFAKLLIVSTPALRDALLAQNDNIKIVPNALDEKLWFSGKTMPEKHKSRVITVGYMGSYTHEEDLDFLERVIPSVQRRLKKNNGITLKFELIGGFKDRAGVQWYKRIHIPSGHNIYPKFVPWLRSVCRWDIALAPLRDTEINRHKSELKYFEYAALGAAGIYSSSAAYTAAVDDGRTGILLASMDAEPWQNAIYTLATESALRHSIIEQARAGVMAGNLLSTRPELIRELLTCPV